MRFTPRFAALLLALAAIGVSIAHGQEGEPIPEEELSAFLGPVSHDQFTWRVVHSVDFDVYYGKANPPLAGSVGFYLGGFPQDVKPGQTTTKSRLGRFPIKWQRRIEADGSISHEAIIDIDGLWLKADVWANAPHENQLNNLLSVLGRLPIFASARIPGRFAEFHEEMARERRIQRLIWLCWSAAVLAAAWLVDRTCRRRKFSHPARWLMFAATVVVAIVLTIVVTIGGPALWPTSSLGPDEIEINLGIYWFKKANGLLLFTAAAGVAGLALLIGLGSFLLRQFRRASR